MFKSNNKTAEKDILAQLMSKYEQLLNYVQNLKLSDLKDVANCMAPNCDEVLTFTGSVWNSIPNSGGNTPDIDAIVEQVLSQLPISEIQESIESLDTRITALEQASPVEVTPKFMVFSNTITTENPNPASKKYETVSLEVRINNYGEIITEGNIWVDANNTFIKPGATFQGRIKVSSGNPKYYFTVLMGNTQLLPNSGYQIDGDTLTIQNVSGAIRVVFNFDYYFVNVYNTREGGTETGWELNGLRFEGVTTDPESPYDFFPDSYRYGSSFEAKPRYAYVPHTKYSDIIPSGYLWIYQTEDRDEGTSYYNSETGNILIPFMNQDIDIRIIPRYAIVRRLLNTSGSNAYDWMYDGELYLNSNIQDYTIIPSGYTLTGSNIELITTSYSAGHPDVTGTMFSYTPYETESGEINTKVSGQFVANLNGEPVNYGVMTWVIANIKKSS